MRFRQFLVPVRHGLLLAVLLCILLARTAVPAGWMPVAGQGGIVLAPCSGMGALKVSTHHDMAAMAMAGTDAAHHSDQRHPDPAGDHPCSGAGVSVALAAPMPALALASTIRVVPEAQAIFAVTIGQGLAAPPPPQTGPPIHV